MNRFLIELDGFFVRKKIIVLPNRDPCQHKMKLFVTTVNSWKLLTSVACSLDPPLLNYDFQKTGEGCSNLFFLLVYVDGGRAFFQWNYRNWCRNPAPVWLDRENYNSALYLVTLSEENDCGWKNGEQKDACWTPKSHNMQKRRMRVCSSLLKLCNKKMWIPLLLPFTNS